jgi:hypothetical protein
MRSSMQRADRPSVSGARDETFCATSCRHILSEPERTGELLVRTSIRAGAPGPTAVEAVNFAGAEVAVTAFAEELRPLDPCAPSALAPDRALVRDVNADGNQDVVIRIKDYTDTLKRSDAAGRLERACSNGQLVKEASRSRQLAFIYVPGGFTASEQAVSLLEIGGPRVEPRLEPWELPPRK